MALGDDQLKNVSAIQDAVSSANEALKAANREAKNIDSAFGRVAGQFTKINQSAEKFIDLQTEAKKSSAATKKALEEQTKQVNIAAKLQVKINSLASSGEAIDRERALILKSQFDSANALAGAYRDMANSAAKLDARTSFFSSISEVVKDIPGLRKLSGPFEVAAKAARETVLSNATAVGISKRALKTGKGLTIEKLKQLNLEELTQGKAGPAAAKLLRNAKATSKTQSVLGAGAKGFAKSAASGAANFLKSGGYVGIIAKAVKMIFDIMVKANVQVTKLGRNFGVSFNQAAALRDSLTQSKTSIDSVYATTENLVQAFTQLSNLSGFIAASSNDQLQTQLELTKQLGLSADEANQLQGLFAVNTEQAEEGSDAVYDQVAAFKNQTGLLADSATIFKEIAGTSKLTRLNFKGGTAELAKTLLNANRLGLSLSQIENIGGSLLDFESSISAEMEAELLTGRQLNLEKARTFALNNDIAGLTQEIANQGITAEKFSSMNRIQQEAIAKSLGMQASELADSLYKQKLIEQTAGSEIRRLNEEIRLAKEKGNLSEAAAIERRKAGIQQGIIDGKSLKAATQAVDAQQKFNLLLVRLKEIFSDLFTGEALNSAVNFFQRIVFDLENKRSLLSIAAFGASSKEDLEGQGKQFKKFDFEADDFTIKTHPKDTLVMAGGTKLGEGSNSNDEVVSLLRELVNRNGDVYLDGQKVGNALSSNYRTMSN